MFNPMISAVFSVSYFLVDMGHDARGGLQSGNWVFSPLIQEL
jgi:hypothetical protein